MAPKASSSRTPSRTDRRQAAVHRRRQKVAHRTAAARKSARRRRSLKALAGVVAVALVVGGALVLVGRDGDDGPSNELRAEKVAGAAGALALSPLPTAYQATYRAESYQGGTTTVSTEEVVIRRPFDGRVAIKEGEPPGGATRFEGRAVLGIYANYTDAGAVQAARDAPTVALGDVRLTTSLDELVRQGLFVLGDRRRGRLDTGSRECQTYRTGSPVQSLKITAPTGTDYVDVCLDSTGLVVEELAVAGGRPTQRLTATSIEADPPLDAGQFAIDAQPVGPDQGGTIVTDVDKATTPAPGYWAPTATPAGFTHQGRYKIEGDGTAGWADAYVRGVELITIRQGPPAAEPDLSEAGPGTDTDLGALGAGKLLLRTIGPTVTGRPGGDTFVHVSGTLSPAELRALASGLVRS